MKFATKTIHAGVHADAATGAIMTPIFQTSTYIQDGPGGHKGYEYARTGNPTRTQLQDNLAALENGKHGLCFGSGMAAIDTVAKLLQPGDELISTNDLYGGTYRIFTKVFANYGIKFHFVDLNDSAKLETLINEKTKMIWIETPTNPMLNVVDIAAVVKIAKAHKLLVCVDNTFASPYLQTPLDMGADLVLHSATKYLGGHSDVVLGAIVTNNDTIFEQCKFLQNACGAVPGPFDCWLVLRGIKTLHLRMDASCNNAMKIANFLLTENAVDKVYYPGLPQHPQHEISKKQMRNFGGMVSFTLKNNNLADAVTVLKSTQLFACAESLGGVESLIGHPATMTHASIPKAEREAVGVVDTLIRLSVGVEDADDLIDDLRQALKNV